MSAQAIVLTVIQTFVIDFPLKQIVIGLLISAIFFSTLTITAAVNYVITESRKWMTMSRLMSSLTVWLFWAGLVTLAVSVMLK
jgi:hypothetical protein